MTKNKYNRKILESNKLIIFKTIRNNGQQYGKKKQGIQQVITDGQQQFDGELEKIQEFYAQFYEIIDEHKRRVIEEMKAEYQKSSCNANTTKQRIEQAILDSSNMKQDILSSMNSVILEVMDHEFRSVMNQYYGNMSRFKQILNIKQEESIKVRTLSFKDGQNVCQALIEGLVIQWNDEQDEEQQQQKYQTRPAGRPLEEPESDRQNPIQCLQTEQRGKSNLKQLGGGLFCSFDQ